MDNGASSYHRFLMGDKNGLSQIVYDYYDGLVLYLYTWLNNLYDAEDMAQETFAVLISKKPAFKGKSSFKTWLYAIGRNETVRYLRKNHRMKVSSPEEIILLATQEQDAAKEYFAGEEKQVLYRCMLRLQSEFRRVLWLKYFEEMSANEIATAMGKTKSSVNHLILRAKDALEKAMNEEGYHV